jgi:hypothetical protein
MSFADASISTCASSAGTGEKPGAVVPHQRSNALDPAGNEFAVIAKMGK